MRWLDGIINSMDMSLSILGDSEGQRILACCIPWAHKESDTPEQPNNNKGGGKEKHQLWVEFLLTFCIDWIIAMGDNN